MVYEAGIVGFFRTILIIGLAYYSIRFIVRVFTKKPGSNSGPMSGSKKSKGKGNDNLGEYVDFEEVED